MFLGERINVFGGENKRFWVDRSGVSVTKTTEL